jgi:hypothetical protein
MPPPFAPAVQCWTMASTTSSVPAFKRQPPSLPFIPSAMVIDCKVRSPPGRTVNGRSVPPPDNVIVPPPSSATVVPIDLGVVSVMVTLPLPQAKVMRPPAASASSSAASVQLSAVPMPTIASARADPPGATAPARHTAMRNRRRHARTTQGSRSRFERATSDARSGAVSGAERAAPRQWRSLGTIVYFAPMRLAPGRFTPRAGMKVWRRFHDERLLTLEDAVPVSSIPGMSDQSMGLRLSDVRP